MSENTMIAKSYRDAIKWALDELGEIKDKTEHKPTGYPDEFEWLWAAYPKRLGSQGDKKKSLGCCNARIKEGEDWKSLARYLKAYEKHCIDREIVSTEFVMQFQKFFGTGEHYKSDWSVAAKPEKKSAQQSLIERANSGELYETKQDYYFRDGKKWICAADYFAGKDPIS